MFPRSANSSVGNLEGELGFILVHWGESAAKPMNELVFPKVCGLVKVQMNILLMSGMDVKEMMWLIHFSCSRMLGEVVMDGIYIGKVYLIHMTG